MSIDHQISVIIRPGKEREFFVFSVATLSIFFLYLCAIPVMRGFILKLGDSTLVSAAFFSVWSLATLVFLNFSDVPRPKFFAKINSWRDWHVFLAPTFVIVVCAISLKNQLDPQYFNLISAESYSIFYALLYCAFVPVQEYIARGILLGALLHYIEGRWRVMLSILISSVVYSGLHLYLGLHVSILVLIPGLCWSWMYYRSTSILLVSLSHICCGLAFIYA